MAANKITMSPDSDIDDMGDVWRAVKADKKARRAFNRGYFLGALHDAGFDPEVKNGGAHLILVVEGVRYDIWPSSLRWQVAGRKGRGVAGLLEHIND